MPPRRTSCCRAGFARRRAWSAARELRSRRACSPIRRGWRARPRPPRPTPRSHGGPPSGLHRSQRLLERGGDLAVRQSAEVGELDDAALRFRERAQRSRHELPRLLSLDVAIGGVAGGERSGEAGVALLCGARQHLGPSPARAHEIERARACDGGEPGGDTAARGVEPAGRAPRLAERVRDDFFRVRAFPDDGARQGVDGAPVAVVQLAQGALVAGGHALNEWPVHGLESGGDSQPVQTVRPKRQEWIGIFRTLGPPPVYPLAMRATTFLAAVAFAVAACRRPPNPPNGEPGVRVVDMIPASLSGETWQDAEPFLTTFASNPNILAASAFTPNPGGPASTTAPIYVSDDGGNTLSLRNTLPSNVQTADITHAPGGPPALYATILSTPSIALKD